MIVHFFQFNLVRLVFYRQIIICPQLLCVEPSCDNPQPTFTIINGKRCPGCPRCPFVCPLVKCPAPSCDNPRPTFIIIDGRKCPGCPRCPFVCPIPACAPPPCDNPQPTFTIINGKQCPGCPRCDSTILEQVWAETVSPRPFPIIIILVFLYFELVRSELCPRIFFFSFFLVAGFSSISFSVS